MKEYLYHSVILASQSTFIDTKLATPLGEREEKVIRFRTLDPSTWDAMMNFLDLLESPKMTPTEAKELAPYYDKYGFTKGSKLCDIILAEVFRGHSLQDIREKPEDLSTWIEVYLLTEYVHLERTKRVANYLFRLMFRSVEYSLLFTGPDIKKLLRLIKSEKLLPTWDWTDEQLSRSTFPDDFIAKRQSRHVIERNLPQVRAVGNVFCAGLFIRENSAPLNHFRLEPIYGSERELDGTRYTLWLAVIQNDWVIYGVDKTLGGSFNGAEKHIFWKCSCGYATQVFPPESGWIQVDNRVGDLGGLYCHWGKPGHF